MNRNALYYIKTGSLILFTCIVCGYSFFQVRNIVIGPQISLQSPLDGHTYINSLVEINGTATNVNYLTINDSPVFTDTAGKFSQKIILGDDLNAIKIYAENKFGKKYKKIIHVILHQETKKEEMLLTPKIPEKTSTTTGNVLPASSTTPTL